MNTMSGKLYFEERSGVLYCTVLYCNIMYRMYSEAGMGWVGRGIFETQRGMRSEPRAVNMKGGVTATLFTQVPDQVP